MVFNYNVEMADRCSMLLAKSRTAAGISRRKMSEAMKVSESTIKAWESGQGSPTFPGIMQWFCTTGENPLYPMLRFFWPDVYENLNKSCSDEEMLHAIHVYLRGVAGSAEIRKLHYLILGDHGSRWDGLLDMFCAHTHTSLDSRYRVADIIHTSYELSQASGTACVLPDVGMDKTLLLDSMNAIKDATISRRDGYTARVSRGDLDKISSRLLAACKRDAGVTNRFIAKAMGKTERTIKNWEGATEPSFLDLCSLFYMLDMPFWPYLRNALYPQEPVMFSEHDRQLCDSLIEYLSHADRKEVRKICYLIFGGHGSNWVGVLELMMEHICSPLPQRVISARSVLVAYQMDLSNRQLRCADHILPNVDSLEECIRLGTRAAKRGEKGYHVAAPDERVPVTQ